MVKIKIQKANNFLQKLKGLIGENNVYPMLIETRCGIHTFGVKFPIDILILNKSRIVKDLKQSLKPNKLFFWNPRYNLVLELPQGFIKAKKIKMGQKINFC